jgi:ketosteroid isomerase-like protein
VGSTNAEIAANGLRMFSEADLEGALAIMHEDVEWHLAFPIPDLPAGKTVYVGHDEVRQVWEAFRGAWETLTVEIEEVLHDEGERLVFRARFRGRGQGSGIEVDRVIFYVFDIRDEKLLRTRPFDTLEQAWAAAGLEP